MIFIGVRYDNYNSAIGLIHVVVDEIGIKKIILFEEDWENIYKKIKILN
ncbi:MAG TPA: hypothetical protein VK071_07810 [Tissierellales bacterium]|nr:hypothetical protein [Tissierellales bacterium]